jgi:phosphate transport system permease protein
MSVGLHVETPPAPVAEVVARPVPTPRKVKSITMDDVLAFVGALLSSFCIVYIGYLHLLDLSGVLGFALCWYAVFIAVYSAVLGVANPGYVVKDRVVAVTVGLAAAIVMAALASTIIYTFVQGWAALTHSNFYTHSMSGVSPTAGLNHGGMLNALVGTVIEVGIAVIISVPLGIGTAVYMTEVGGRLSQYVRTVVEAMTAIPEILAGLFVYVVLIVEFGMPKSGLAVSVAMSVTMVPIIARAGEVALRVVPSGLREASSALGATHWKTVYKVVLPSARAGLATATILAIARGVGETAIPLITSGASSFMQVSPVGNPMNSLPLYIYTAYVSHEPVQVARAFGAASVLLVVVLALFAAARFLVREKKPSR